MAVTENPYASEEYRAAVEAFIRGTRPTKCWICAGRWTRRDEVLNLTAHKPGDRSRWDMVALCKACHEGVLWMAKTKKLTMRQAIYRFRDFHKPTAHQSRSTRGVMSGWSPNETRRPLR